MKWTEQTGPHWLFLIKKVEITLERQYHWERKPIQAHFSKLEPRSKSTSALGEAFRHSLLTLCCGLSLRASGPPMASAALSARGRQVLHSVYWLSKRDPTCAGFGGHA